MAAPEEPASNGGWSISQKIWGGGSTADGAPDGSESTRLSPAQVLPYFESDASCPACKSRMAVQEGPPGTSSCSICTLPVSKASGPLAFVHLCRDCDMVVCAPCNQTLAVQRVMKARKAQIQEMTSGSVIELEAKLPATEAALKQAEVELKAAQAEHQAQCSEAKAAIQHAQLTHERLEESFAGERDTFTRATDVIRSDLTRKDDELRRTLKELERSQIYIAEAADREAAALKAGEIAKVGAMEEMRNAERTIATARARSEELAKVMQGAEALEAQLRGEAAECRKEQTSILVSDQRRISEAYLELDTARAESAELVKAAAQAEEEANGGGGVKGGFKRFWGKVRQVARELDPLPMDEALAMQERASSSRSPGGYPPSRAAAPAVPAHTAAQRALFAECCEWQQNSDTLLERINTLHDSLSSNTAEITQLREAIAALRAEESEGANEIERVCKALERFDKRWEFEHRKLQKKLKKECLDSRTRMLAALDELRRRDSVEAADLMCVYGPECDWTIPSPSAYSPIVSPRSSPPLSPQMQPSRPELGDLSSLDLDSIPLPESCGGSPVRNMPIGNTLIGSRELDASLVSALLEKEAQKSGPQSYSIGHT